MGDMSFCTDTLGGGCLLEPVSVRTCLLHSIREGADNLTTGQALAALGLLLFYFPPRHPRGVSTKEALAGLDWIGMALFVPALTIALGK